jgi:LysR family nitrogen assimilation transcriptional regulator
MTGYIIDWLRNGQLDIGLVFADAPVSGIQAEPLLSEELHLAAGSTAALKPLLNRAGEVPMAALATVPLVLPTDRHGLRMLIDQHLRRHGVSSRVIIEIDAFLQIQRLVQRGHGMTILSLAALQQTGLAPPLVTAHIVRPAIRRTVSLAHVDNRPLTKAAREVAKLAAGVLRAAAAESWWNAEPVG